MLFGYNVMSKNVPEPRGNLFTSQNKKTPAIGAKLKGIQLKVRKYAVLTKVIKATPHVFDLPLLAVI